MYIFRVPHSSRSASLLKEMVAFDVIFVDRSGRAEVDEKALVFANASLAQGGAIIALSSV